MLNSFQHPLCSTPRIYEAE